MHTSKIVFSFNGSPTCGILYNGWQYAVVIFNELNERMMKQRNLIGYTAWLQQNGFIKSDVVIESLTSEYAEQLSDKAVENNAVLPFVSGSAVLRDKHGREIFTGEKFRFKLMKELDEHIELLGSFDYNDEELRYKIDIWDNADYICLSYIANGTMYDFELL